MDNLQNLSIGIIIGSYSEPIQTILETIKNNYRAKVSAKANVLIEVNIHTRCTYLDQKYTKK